MCQICLLALCHQKFSSRNLPSLNPKPLSVSIKLNPRPVTEQKTVLSLGNCYKITGLKQKSSPN
jgi:hypothetical protein